MIETAEQFQEAVRQYAVRHNLSQRELAAQIGKPRQTVEDWCRLGVKSRSHRERIILAHPEIFANYEPQQVVQVAEISGQVTPNSSHELLVLLKTELARQSIATLTEVLRWFLFEASASDRSLLRESLGENWPRFLNRVRALASEKAREIAQEERRLE